MKTIMRKWYCIVNRYYCWRLDRNINKQIRLRDNAIELYCEYEYLCAQCKHYVNLASDNEEETLCR